MRFAPPSDIWLPLEAEWNVSVARARSLQQEMAALVSTGCSPEPVQTVAGVDAAFRNDVVRAAAVVVSLPELQSIASAAVEMKVNFPYVPGLLAFREGPALIEAIHELDIRPDVLIFDGHGIAHPRRFGIASHAGVLLDTATIGCAKTNLSGTCMEPQSERGEHELIVDGEEVIGAAVRTRTGVNPVFVSIGHLMDLQGAINLILQCSRKHRIPEPLRKAHQLSKFSIPNIV